MGAAHACCMPHAWGGRAHRHRTAQRMCRRLPYLGAATAAAARRRAAAAAATAFVAVAAAVAIGAAATRKEPARDSAEGWGRARGKGALCHRWGPRGALIARALARSAAGEAGRCRDRVKGGARRTAKRPRPMAYGPSRALQEFWHQIEGAGAHFAVIFYVYGVLDKPGMGRGCWSGGKSGPGFTWTPLPICFPHRAKGRDINDESVFSYVLKASSLLQPPPVAARELPAAAGAWRSRPRQHR